MNIYEKQQLFQQQFRALYAYVYRYVALRIFNAPEIEDVAALACTEAYTQLNKYDETKGSLQQWLTGIVRFKVIDYWRQKKIVLPLDDAETVIDEIDLKHNSEKILDEKLLFQKIMQQLSNELRMLFTLRYIDDLTYEDIAKL